MPLLISFVLSLQMANSSGSLDSAQELRFAPTCQVGDVIAARNAPVLRVFASNGNQGTAALLLNDRLFHWRESIDLWNIVAIGRSKEGELLLVVEFQTASDKPYLRYCCFGVPAQDSNRPRLLCYYSIPRTEGLPRFLPSQRDVFFTGLRIYNAVRQAEPVAIANDFRVRLADFVGENSMIAIGHANDQSRLAICEVNISNGQTKELELRSQVSSSHSAQSAFSQSDFEVSKINSISMVPTKLGRCIIELVSPVHGSTILSVSTTGDYEILFSSKEPIYSVAFDRSGSLVILTEQGILGLSNSKEWEFRGVPKYHECGGFLVAENVPGLMAVLSAHSRTLPHLKNSQKRGFIISVNSKEK